LENSCSRCLGDDEYSNGSKGSGQDKSDPRSPAPAKVRLRNEPTTYWLVNIQ
jgi:hypothetical protein